MVPRRSNTRERLIATATRLFWRDGYSRTGVSSIIQQAGATSGSFYHFFATKEELFLAVLSQVEEKLEETVYLAAADRSEPVVDRVLSLFALHRQHLEKHAYEFGLSMTPLAADLGDGQATVRTRVAEIVESWQQRIEAELLSSNSGEADRSGTHDLAAFILAVLEGATLQACTARSSAPFDACEREIRRHLDTPLAHEDAHPTEDDRTYQSVPAKGTSARDWRAW